MYSLGGMVAIIGASTRRIQTRTPGTESHVKQGPKGDRDRTATDSVLKPKNTS